MKARHILAVLLLFSSFVVSAQKLTINGLKMVTNPKNPEFGNLIWAKGSSVTKNGHAIPFQPELKNDSIMVGYSYNSSSLESVSENDVLLLFVPKLKYRSSWQVGKKTSYDDSDKKVFGIDELNGAWKELTVSKKYKEGENFVIIFTESCKL